MALSTQDALRLQLAALGLQQKDFARAFGCTQSSLSQWFNGRTLSRSTHSTITNIALCFMYVYGIGEMHSISEEAYSMLDRLIEAAQTLSSEALRSALQAHMMKMNLRQEDVAREALVSLSQLTAWMASATAECSTRVSIKVHAYLALHRCVPPLQLVSVPLCKHAGEAGSFQLQQHAATCTASADTTSLPIAIAAELPTTMPLAGSRDHAIALATTGISSAQVMVPPTMNSAVLPPPVLQPCTVNADALPPRDAAKEACQRGGEEAREKDERGPDAEGEPMEVVLVVDEDKDKDEGEEDEDEESEEDDCEDADEVQADDGEGVYAVEYLVAARTGPQKRKLYRVRWKGYGPEDDTWEDEGAILDPILIWSFERFEQLRDEGGLRSVALEHARKLNLTHRGIAGQLGEATAEWLSGKSPVSERSPPPRVEARLREWLELTMAYADVAPPAMRVHHSDDDVEQRLLADLTDALIDWGGTINMLAGWRAFRWLKQANGTSQNYYLSPGGKRFRSRIEVGRYLNLDVSSAGARSLTSTHRPGRNAQPPASNTINRRASLVRRLKQHMAMRGLTQAAVLKQAKAPEYGGRLSSWLRGYEQSKETKEKVDELVAAYLAKAEGGTGAQSKGSNHKAREGGRLAAAAAGPLRATEVSSSAAASSAVSRKAKTDLWVQCERCQKWRRLAFCPAAAIARAWFCELNPDPLHDDCSYEEECKGSDEESGDECAMNVGEDGSPLPPQAYTSISTYQEKVPSTKALGKRPASSQVARASQGASQAPPGCFPPKGLATKFSLGYQKKSEDGSMWEVDMNVKYPHGSRHPSGPPTWRWFWRYVPPSASETSRRRRPLPDDEAAGGVDAVKKEPTYNHSCKFCGKPLQNRAALASHEKFCGVERAEAKDLGAEIPDPGHESLVARMKEHMLAQGLSLKVAAKRAKISSSGQLGLWLGRCQQPMSTASRHDLDAVIAAYLKRLGGAIADGAVADHTEDEMEVVGEVQVPAMTDGREAGTQAGGPPTSLSDDDALIAGFMREHDDEKMDDAARVAHQPAQTGAMEEAPTPTAPIPPPPTRSASDAEAIEMVQPTHPAGHHILSRAQLAAAARAYMDEGGLTQKAFVAVVHARVRKGSSIDRNIFYPYQFSQWMTLARYPQRAKDPHFIREAKACQIDQAVAEFLGCPQPEAIGQGEENDKEDQVMEEEDQAMEEDDQTMEEEDQTMEEGASRQPIHLRLAVSPDGDGTIAVSARVQTLRACVRERLEASGWPPWTTAARGIRAVAGVDTWDGPADPKEGGMPTHYLLRWFREDWSLWSTLKAAEVALQVEEQVKRWVEQDAPLPTVAVAPRKVGKRPAPDEDDGPERNIAARTRSGGGADGRNGPASCADSSSSSSASSLSGSEGSDVEEELRAELLPIADDWPTVRRPPAPPPPCDCGAPCVWLRGRWFCAREGEDGCGFESEAPPEPTPLTPLCRCHVPAPCKWLLGRWWCRRHPASGCGFEHAPESHPEPILLVDAAATAPEPTPMCSSGGDVGGGGGGGSDRFSSSGGGGGGHHARPPRQRRRWRRLNSTVPTSDVADIRSAETEAAAECAALLTACAFGLGDWCFVAPSDCGLGLFARTALRRGQAICEYSGPRLPLDALNESPSYRGEYVLEIPGTGLALDGARHNCVSCLPSGAHLCPAIYANHSSSYPNAALEYWPEEGGQGSLDRLVLVATRPIPAGREVRFDYEAGAKRGTYWSGSRTRPSESSRWRWITLPAPPPTCEEPVIDYLNPRPSAFADDQQQPRPPQHSRAADDSHRIRDGGGGGGGDTGGTGGGAAAGSESWREARGACPPYGSSFAPHRPPPPVPWEGPCGGDAVLEAIIRLIQPSAWLRRCMRAPDGKVKMWQVVATHLDGRTPDECKERWRTLNRRRAATAAAAAAAATTAAAEGGGE